MRMLPCEALDGDGVSVLLVDIRMVAGGGVCSFWWDSWVSSDKAVTVWLVLLFARER